MNDESHPLSDRLINEEVGRSFEVTGEGAIQSLSERRNFHCFGAIEFKCIRNACSRVCSNAVMCTPRCAMGDSRPKLAV